MRQLPDIPTLWVKELRHSSYALRFFDEIHIHKADLFPKRICHPKHG